jgi:hypothetical protein
MSHSQVQMQMGSSGAEHRLYTVGHSNHELPAFLDLLERAGITAIADVRSSPFSRRLPQFNRPTLDQALRRRGLAYVFLGGELGGRPSDPEVYDSVGQVDYERVRRTRTFASGLDRLCTARSKFALAVMCGEADPLNCHRGLMIAPALVERDVFPDHLRKDGTVETSREFEDRLLAATRVGSGIVDGLFAGMLAREERKAFLAEAYRLRARQVAYRLPREGPDASLPEEGEDLESW